MSATSDPAHVHLHHHPRGSLQRAGIRFALLLLLLAGGFAAVRWTPLGDYLTAERLQGLLGELRGSWWSPLVLIGTCMVFGALGVPATPFLLAGAAIFGPVWGTLWNWVAILLASALGYLPPIAIITYFTSALMKAASGERAATAREFVIVSITAAILVFLPIGIRRRNRQRRLRALRARRAARSALPRNVPPAA